MNYPNRRPKLCRIFYKLVYLKMWTQSKRVINLTRRAVNLWPMSLSNYDHKLLLKGRTY